MGNLYMAVSNLVSLAFMYFLYIGIFAFLETQKGKSILVLLALGVGSASFISLTVLHLNMMRILPGAHLYRDAQVFPLTAAITAPYWIALAFLLINTVIAIVEQFKSKFGARRPSLVRLIMLGVFFLSVAYLWEQAYMLLQLIRPDYRYPYSQTMLYLVPACIWALFGVYRMARQYVKPTPDAPASPPA